jgi:ribose/xylose/arabinose/galactoside ABC-type transport system permease subunit
MIMFQRFFNSAGIGGPLIVLWIILGIFAPRFFTLTNFGNLSVQFAIIGALAIGSTAVIICKEIDLSIGAIEGFCAVIAGICIVNFGIPWPVSILIAISSGALVGAVNGCLVSVVGIPSFVVTLGSLGIVSGISLLITGGRSVYGFPEAYQWIGQGDLFYIRSPILFTGLLLVFMHVVLKNTIFGLNIYAVGGNENSANLVGISSLWTKFFSFLISGASAGLAGVIISSRLNAANPTLGALDLLDAIAAIVIGGASLSGGIGTVIGTAGGVLLIVSIRNGLNLMGINPFWQQTAIGSVILIAAIFDRIRDKSR